MFSLKPDSVLRVKISWIVLEFDSWVLGATMARDLLYYSKSNQVFFTHATKCFISSNSCKPIYSKWIFWKMKPLFWHSSHHLIFHEIIVLSYSGNETILILWYTHDKIMINLNVFEIDFRLPTLGNSSSKNLCKQEVKMSRYFLLPSLSLFP